MSITLTKITPQHHQSALDWLASVFPGQDTDNLSPQQTYRVVQHWYPGGWAQLVVDHDTDVTNGN